MAADPRHIACPDTRRIVLRAIELGWVLRGLTGTSHWLIEHPPTGTKLTFAGTPKVASWKSLATDIEKVSGRGRVWRKANRKVSKRKHTHTDFLDTRPAPAQLVMRERNAGEADTYRGIWDRMQKGDLSKAMIARLLAAEETLRRNYQPCPINGEKWFSEYFDDRKHSA